jgi:hypothetical protein
MVRIYGMVCYWDGLSYGVGVRRWLELSLAGVSKSWGILIWRISLIVLVSCGFNQSEDRSLYLVSLLRVMYGSAYFLIRLRKEGQGLEMALVYIGKVK